jgi:hypothetical protein
MNNLSKPLLDLRSLDYLIPPKNVAPFIEAYENTVTDDPLFCGTVKHKNIVLFYFFNEPHEAFMLKGNKIVDGYTYLSRGVMYDGKWLHELL